MLRKAPAGGRGEGGQTLVEFAIVLPVFLLVVFGLFDVGRLVFTSSTLSQGAREGTRLAAAQASWIGVSAPSCATQAEIDSSRPGGHICPVNVAEFKANITTAVNGMTTTLGAINAVYISCHDGTALDQPPTGEWSDGPADPGNGCKDVAGNAIASSGDLVAVRIEYDYNTFTPIINTFIGQVPLSASATMIIN